MRSRSADAPAEDGAGHQAWIRWRRPGLIAGALLALAVVLYLARGALFPFVISVVLAQLLYPVVAFVETRLPSHERWPGMTRIASIFAIYVVFGLVMAGIAYITIPPLFHEAEELVHTFPNLYERARETAESWSRDLTERIPVELRAQVENAVAAGGDVLAAAASGILERTVSGVSNAVTLVIGLAIVPFFLFFILKDREEVVGGFYPMLSPHGRTRARHVFQLVNSVIGSYVRAQLLSATIVGGLVFIGLTILGIKFAAILGLVAGLFGLIPIIGPVLGAVPGLLVTLASSPDRIIGVVLVYVIVQLVENNVISPRIQGSALRLNPAFIMIILVVSSEIAGLWGVIVGVPLVAAGRDVFVYFYNEWNGSHTVELQSPLPEPDNAALDSAEQDETVGEEPKPSNSP